jgi:hypothetical protein
LHLGFAYHNIIGTMSESFPPRPLFYPHTESWNVLASEYGV